jgi:hypothetical protein
MENKKVKNSLIISTKDSPTPLGRGSCIIHFQKAWGARQIVHLHGLKTALLNTLVYGCCPACASPQVKKFKLG